MGCFHSQDEAMQRERERHCKRATRLIEAFYGLNPPPHASGGFYNFYSNSSTANTNQNASSVASFAASHGMQYFDHDGNVVDPSMLLQPAAAGGGGSASPPASFGEGASAPIPPSALAGSSDLTGGGGGFGGSGGKGKGKSKKSVKINVDAPKLIGASTGLSQFSTTNGGSSSNLTMSSFVKPDDSDKFLDALTAALRHLCNISDSDVKALFVAFAYQQRDSGLRRCLLEYVTPPPPSADSSDNSSSLLLSFPSSAPLTSPAFVGSSFCQNANAANSIQHARRDSNSNSSPSGQSISHPNSGATSAYASNAPSATNLLKGVGGDNNNNNSNNSGVTPPQTPRASTNSRNGGGGGGANNNNSNNKNGGGASDFNNNGLTPLAAAFIELVRSGVINIGSNAGGAAAGNGAGGANGNSSSAANSISVGNFAASLASPSMLGASFANSVMSPGTPASAKLGNRSSITFSPNNTSLTSLGPSPFSPSSAASSSLSSSLATTASYFASPMTNTENAHLASIIATWMKYDKDCSGTMSAKELSHLIHAMNFPSTLKQRLKNDVTQTLSQRSFKELTFREFQHNFSTLHHFPELFQFWKKAAGSNNFMPSFITVRQLKLFFLREQKQNIDHVFAASILAQQGLLGSGAGRGLTGGSGASNSDRSTPMSPLNLTGATLVNTFNNSCPPTPSSQNNGGQTSPPSTATTSQTAAASSSPRVLLSQVPAGAVTKALHTFIARVTGRGPFTHAEAMRHYNTIAASTGGGTNDNYMAAIRELQKVGSEGLKGIAQDMFGDRFGFGKKKEDEDINALVDKLSEPSKPEKHYERLLKYLTTHGTLEGSDYNKRQRGQSVMMSQSGVGPFSTAARGSVASPAIGGVAAFVASGGNRSDPNNMSGASSANSTAHNNTAASGGPMTSELNSAYAKANLLNMTVNEAELFILDECAYVSRDQFIHLLTHPEFNAGIDPRHRAIRLEEMNEPLCNYFINSSHNTYLTGDQLTGKSSADMYRRTLEGGCRCVEIDCWEGGWIDQDLNKQTMAAVAAAGHGSHHGGNGTGHSDHYAGANSNDANNEKKKKKKRAPQVIVYHGYTTTTRIAFEEVIETINRYAFATSDYPVTLSFEIHVDNAHQAYMAKVMRQVFGDKLCYPIVNPQTEVTADQMVVQQLAALANSHNGGGGDGNGNGDEMYADAMNNVTNSNDTNSNLADMPMFHAPGLPLVCDDDGFKPYPFDLLTQFTPEQLKGKIIVKAKRIPRSFEEADDDEDEESEEEDDDDEDVDIMASGPNTRVVAKDQKREAELQKRQQAQLAALEKKRGSAVSESPLSARGGGGGGTSPTFAASPVMPSSSPLTSSRPPLAAPKTTAVLSESDMRHAKEADALQLKIAEASGKKIKKKSVTDSFRDQRKRDKRIQKEFLKQQAREKKARRKEREREKEREKHGGKLSKLKVGWGLHEITAMDATRKLGKITFNAKGNVPFRLDALECFRSTSHKENKSLSMMRGIPIFLDHNAPAPLLPYHELNKHMVSRIYPHGKRIDSSNFHPMPHWTHGCQMVALNWQTTDSYELRLNKFKFMFDNGNCGYIRKPAFLRQFVLKDEKANPLPRPVVSQYLQSWGVFGPGGNELAAIFENNSLFNGGGSSAHSGFGGIGGVLLNNSVVGGLTMVGGKIADGFGFLGGKLGITGGDGGAKGGHNGGGNSKQRGGAVGGSNNNSLIGGLHHNQSMMYNSLSYGAAREFQNTSNLMNNGSNSNFNNSANNSANARRPPMLHHQRLSSQDLENHANFNNNGSIAGANSSDGSHTAATPANNAATVAVAGYGGGALVDSATNSSHTLVNPNNPSSAAAAGADNNVSNTNSQFNTPRLAPMVAITPTAGSHNTNNALATADNKNENNAGPLPPFSQESLLELAFTMYQQYKLADFTRIRVTAVSGFQLPKPDRSEQGEIVDPYVLAYLEGPDLPLCGNGQRLKTVFLDNNGFHPVWPAPDPASPSKERDMSTHVFDLGRSNGVTYERHWEGSMLVLQVYDWDYNTDDFLAEVMVPLKFLRPGIRYFPLYDKTTTLLQGAFLMCRIEFLP